MGVIERRPIRVTLPVVAGEIGTGLGRRHHIVGRDRVVGVRERDVDDRRALSAQHVNRRGEGRANIVVDAIVQHLPRDPDGRVRHRLGQRRVERGQGLVGRSRVAGVLASHGLEQRGRVGDGQREGADLVE